MEYLFRFLQSRPVAALLAEENAIPVRPSPAIDSKIRAAFTQARRSELLRQASKEALAGADSIPKLVGDSLSVQARGFASAIQDDAIEDAPGAKAKVTEVFGSDAATLVATAAFKKLSQAAIDVAVAIKYGGRTVAKGEELVTVVRVFEYLKRLAAGTAEDTSPILFLQRVLVLEGLQGTPPDQHLPGNDRPRERESERPSDNGRTEMLKGRVAMLEGAISELTVLRPEQLDITPQPSSPRAAAARTSSVAVRSTARRTKSLSAMNLSGPDVLATQPSPLRLSAAAEAQLTADTRKTVEAFGGAAGVTNLPLTLNHLEGTLKSAGSELAELTLREAPVSRVIRVGGAVLEVDGLPTVLSGAGASASAAPTTFGNIKSVGWGDLLFVKQSLKGYEARELSHVENILKSEHKSSQTKRTRTTEETTVTEQETTTVDERDQQTTDRFEMQQESSLVQKEDESIKLGASISASYGPMVEFKATSELGMSSSKEESTKSSTNYAKDITTRASTKVTDRVLKSLTRKVVQSLEEDDIHEWDNKLGADHIVGQYQWLEKRYEAQVYNYGARMLFDVVVPEPSAFLAFGLGSKPKAGAEIVKPTPFTLTPADINVGNYSVYVHRYNAVGVEAPPEPTATIVKALEGADDRDNRGAVTKTAEVPIADGYVATNARVSAASTFWAGDWAIVVTVGTRMWRLQGPGSWQHNETALNNQQKAISCSVLTHQVATFTVTIEIDCMRTPRALEQWRIKTHAAIKDGYLKMLKDYEDDVAAAKATEEILVHGRNPDINTQLQREELKKAFITLLTAQHFDSFDAVDSGSYGYPQLSLTDTGPQGAYIRFFEQAFEWEQMMYFYYPYYWGRKSGWVRAVLVEDNDPQFTAFLKSGAARVVVSARPGFEAAVGHFLETGQIWEGGDPPTVTSLTYLNIVDEIKAQQGASKGEEPFGDPWEVRVPTSLVMLRRKASLPKWAKNPDGEWVDASED